MQSTRVRNTKGFTLVEMLVAMFVVTLLSAGLFIFMVDVSKGIFWGTEKAEISEDVRTFTMRIAAEARSANSAYIYTSFNKEDRDQDSDKQKAGQSGDCLVLVNTEYYPDSDSPTHYTRIIVYYRIPDDEGDEAGPVHRYEWEASGPSQYVSSVGPGGAAVPLESVLTSKIPNIPKDDPVVIELSRGVADGRLFTNYKDTTIVINGEILHGNKVKEVTNTYNLSISPRG
ncbi:MAG: PulJ/GspJ family protein [Puniceicoccales bacterium]